MVLVGLTANQHSGEDHAQDGRNDSSSGSGAGRNPHDLWFSDWGSSSGPFFGTLLLAGVGWNLVFTTGSTMLVEAVSAIDRPKAQGISESMAIVGSCVGTLASGFIWGSTSSWATVCYCAGGGEQACSRSACPAMLADDACACAGPVLLVSLTAVAGIALRTSTGGRAT